RKRTLLIKRSDHVIGVEHSEPIDQLDVPSRHQTRAFFFKTDGVGARRFSAENNLFEVENDVSYVLDNVRNRSELMKTSVHTDGGDGCSLKRSQEHPAKGVTNGNAEPTLKRLTNKASVEIG